MYVIAGATGRVGHQVADNLLAALGPERADQVRMLTRNPAGASSLAQTGAEVAEVDLRDDRAVQQALRGAEAFFAMLPFDLSQDDLAAHAEAISSSLATAVARAGTPRVVMLSSIGADLPSGTGPIAGVHALEQHLSETGAIVTAFRPTHFQEKVGDLLDAARREGIYPVFATTADRPVPMVATRDVAEFLAQAMLTPAAASETVDVVGPSYPDREGASTLATALGRPVDVVVIPEPGWQSSLQEAGFSAPVAASLAQMYHADDAGQLLPRGDRVVHGDTELATTIAGMLAGESSPR